MSNLYWTRLEIRGACEHLIRFQEPLAQTQLAGCGVFDGVSEIERVADEWARDLELEIVEGRTGSVTYHWTSRYPHNFVQSLATKFPELVFIVSLRDESDSVCGTAVLKGDRCCAKSWADGPIVLDPDDPEEPRSDYHRRVDEPEWDPMYGHYLKALELAGIDGLSNTSSVISKPFRRLISRRTPGTASPRSASPRRSP